MNLIRHVPDLITLFFKLNAIPATILNRESEEEQKGLRYTREGKQKKKRKTMKGVGLTRSCKTTTVPE